MPGTTSAVHGIMNRHKGRVATNAAFLQQIGSGGAFAAGGGNIYANLTPAGNGADTTEDTLFTFSLPANTLDVTGRAILITAFGNVTATSATKTVKLYFGSSLTESSAWTTTQTGGWQIVAAVYKTGASTQAWAVQMDAIGATAPRLFVQSTSGSETDTAAITIKITGQSTAATANLVVCNGFVISGMN